MSVKKYFLRTGQDFRSSEQGGVAIYFALSLIAIMTMIGLVLDYGRALNLKSGLGAAADAAALASARDPDVTSDNLQQRAEAFFAANTNGRPFGDSFTITATELTNGNGVHIDVTAQVNTTLVALAGIPHFIISAQSEAVFSPYKVELAMVLDNTGSMGSSNKIEALRTASSDMINLLIPDGAPEGNVKIGIIPFDIGVNVGIANTGATWLDETNANGSSWEGCIGPRDGGNDVSDSSATGADKIPAIFDDQTNCSLSSILPLSTDKVVLLGKANNMQSAGWTYIPEGLAWGWRVLSPLLPFSEGVAYSEPDWTKIIVLMTDGANTVKWDWPDGFPEADKGVSSSTGNVRTATLCQNIKDQNIIIYTVAFQVDSNSTRQMLEDCATTPGHYFDAQNNSALQTAFSKISGEINNLRLSK